MMRRTLLIAALLFIPLVTQAKKAPAKSDGPRHNYLDMRGAEFFCVNDSCVLDISKLMMIGCTSSGCALITDLIVSSGSVKRVEQRK